MLLASLLATPGPSPLLVCVQRNIATAVEFIRLWWDKRSSNPSLTGVSFWRPVPPPGYVSLGDCMVTGVYAPPQVCVVRKLHGHWGVCAASGMYFLKAAWSLGCMRRLRYVFFFKGLSHGQRQRRWMFSLGDCMVTGVYAPPQVCVF